MTEFPVVLGGVKDTGNDDVPASDSKKNLIREAVGENAAKTPVVKREEFGICFQSEESLRVIGEEFITQSGVSRLIPVVRVPKVFFGPESYRDRPVHKRDSRICRKTSRQASPELGSRSNSANALSSACRSEGMGAPSSIRSAS